MARLLVSEKTGTQSKELYGLFRAKDTENSETRLTRQAFAITSPEALFVDLVIESSGSKAKDEGDEERSDTDSGFREAQDSYPVIMKAETPDSELNFSFLYYGTLDPNLRGSLSSLSTLFDSVPSQTLVITDIVTRNESTRRLLDILSSKIIGPTRRAAALHTLSHHVIPSPSSMAFDKIHAHVDLGKTEKISLALDGPIVLVFSDVEVDYRQGEREPECAVWKVAIYEDVGEAVKAFGCGVR
jgi:hypothetical protein